MNDSGSCATTTVSLGQVFRWTIVLFWSASALRLYWFSDAIRETLQRHDSLKGLRPDVPIDNDHSALENFTRR